MFPGIDDLAMKTRVREALNRWPTVGLAVGVVRDGALSWFHGHGVADLTTNAPVTEDTVFRIGSITKAFTAIAVMQLEERGLVDLDAPASDYLRAYPLVPARPGFQPATLRHLLTHTAGVRAVRRASDLLRPEAGWSAPAGGPVPSLADYYRGGLHVDTEPGTRWAYSNHGFATLGQIVADVTGLPFDRYLGEHVLAPLGMESSRLGPAGREPDGQATGYILRSAGLRAVPHREVVPAGGGAIYSTMRDMARCVAALLDGGVNRHGSVLRPETLAQMYAPHYQPDPRIPGMGLAFFRGEAGSHRTVGHDGVWPGFSSDMLLAPDQGIGVIALANTGGFDPRGVAAPVANTLLCSLLGLPDDVVRPDVPEHPGLWGDLCDRYSFGPGWLTDPQPRAVFGGGVDVVVRRGHLWARGRMPIPAIRRGLRLYPEAHDPYAFRVDLSGLGLGTSRVVFSRGPDGLVDALHIALTPMSFHKRPNRSRPVRRAAGA